MADVDWVEVRRAFPAAANYTYLKTGSGGALCCKASEACASLYRDWAEHGDLHFGAHSGRLETLRLDLAGALGANRGDADGGVSCSQVALMGNASEGLATAAFLLSQGGTVPLSVVALENEFPSVTLPFVSMGAEVHLVPCAEVERRGAEDAIIEAVQRLEGPQTVCLAVSHVSFSDGRRVSLEVLGLACRAAGAWFVVDASQSFGAFRVNVRDSHIDALCCNAYKWLCAGYGGGFAYFSEQLLARHAGSPTVGWANVKEFARIDGFQLRDGATRFEAGAPNFPGLVALHASLSFLQSLGWDAVESRVLQLSGYLTRALTAAGYELRSPCGDAERSGNVVVRVRGCPRELSASLQQRGILVAPKAPEGALRVSAHVYNSEEDLDVFVAALRELDPPVERREAASL